MLKQLFVTVGIIVSSFLMEQFYIVVFVDGLDSNSTDKVFFSIVAGYIVSFVTAIVLADLPSFDFEWRGWFRALVGMGFQALTVLTIVALQSPEIGTGFLVHTAVIAVITAFLLAAVLFAPEKKEDQRTPQQKEKDRLTANRI